MPVCLRRGSRVGLPQVFRVVTVDGKGLPGIEESAEMFTTIAIAGTAGGFRDGNDFFQFDSSHGNPFLWNSVSGRLARGHIGTSLRDDRKTRTQNVNTTPTPQVPLVAVKMTPGL